MDEPPAPLMISKARPGAALAPGLGGLSSCEAAGVDGLRFPSANFFRAASRSCSFGTVAGACSVNCRDRRHVQRREWVKNFLAFRDEAPHFTGLRLLQQRLQIRAFDEDRLLR